MAIEQQHSIGIRSPLKRGLVYYLTAMAKCPIEDTLPCLKGRSFAQLYISPDVLKQGPEYERKAWRHCGNFPDQEQVDLLLTGEDHRRRLPWNLECRRIHHAAAIRGTPGSGKSLLALMTASKLAQISLKALDTEHADISQIALPVLLRLTDVANEDLATAAENHIRSFVSGYGLEDEDKSAFDAVVSHIPRRLSDSQTWLFLDALDEVPEPSRLKKKLAPLTRAKCRILLTSRYDGYEPGYLPFQPEATYELASLTTSQLRRFIESFFTEDEPKKVRLLQLLRNNPRFDDLCRNPLLLTLTCAAAQGHGCLRRTDLYRRILGDLVRCIWKDRNSHDEQTINLFIRVLSHVAWDLFHSNPARTVLSHDKWCAALLSAVKTFGLNWHIDEVFMHLKSSGLIICSAAGEWRLMHRSLLEFLAAEHVAKQKYPLASIRQFLWHKDKDGVLRWEPSAEEVICFLGGCMKDPNRLLRKLLELDRKQRDCFRVMLLLAGRALSEIEEKSLDNPLAREIAGRIVALWRKGGPVEALGWRMGCTNRWTSPGTKVDRLMAGIVHLDCVRQLLMGQSGKNSKVKIRALTLLGETGDERSIEALVVKIQADVDLRVNKRAWRAHERAIFALGQIDTERTVDVLIKFARHNASPYIKRTAIRALGLGGGEQRLNALADLARDAELKVIRWFAVDSLEMIGADERVVEPLLQILQKDEEPDVRRQAVRALGQISTEQAVEALIGALRKDSDSSVRRGAAFALAELGENRAVEPIISCLTKREASCGMPMEALAIIGSEQAVEALIDRARNDPDRDVSKHAMRCLGRAGSHRAVDALLEIARDHEDPGCRKFATICLGNIGGDRETKALLAMQNDEQIRFEVPTAIGHLGCHAVIEQLLKYLRKTNACVGKEAACALCHIDSDRAVEAVADRLRKDVNRDVRESLVFDLGRTASEKAIDVLIDVARSDKSPSVRDTALYELGKIASERSTEPLLEMARRPRVWRRFWPSIVTTLGFICQQTGRWIPQLQCP